LTSLALVGFILERLGEKYCSRKRQRKRKNSEETTALASVAKKNCMQLGDLQDNASTVAAIGAIILASLVVLGLLLFCCYRWRRRNQFMKVRALAPCLVVGTETKRKREGHQRTTKTLLLGVWWWFAELGLSRRPVLAQVLREIELEATGDWGQQGSKKRGAWDEDASSAFDWDEDDTAATSSGGEEHDTGRAFSSSSVPPPPPPGFFRSFALSNAHDDAHATHMKPDAHTLSQQHGWDGTGGRRAVRARARYRGG
jgi:hypothetical protein